MRQLAVYKANQWAGVLSELDYNHFQFAYNETYLASPYPAISVTMPKQAEPYQSNSLFPLFANMLPEGVNRNTICRLNHIDEQDYFGLLMFFVDKDIIGDISLKLIRN